MQHARRQAAALVRHIRRTLIDASSRTSPYTYGRSYSPYEKVVLDQAQVAAVATQLVESYGAQVGVFSALLATTAVCLVAMVIYIAKLKARTVVESKEVVDETTVEAPPAARADEPKEDMTVTV
ncbi:hypothetical protein H257_02127 [Aphanomyces astaci]|uniref:Uncharacterized protein n=1 Tax=Aphanomyces astaci TaxID=112090 RepID=W4H777_APHAT|nr:hypothetical protein H257_02127 [Aphanomyces astaci]ETV87139.1 hypothetical protein H257_02127 [Aphanomyces astaci]|eukprot:XP_009823938.1 hypothetical protein H257_02127 [Aphanomyces astaci]